jgi:phospholipase C
MKPFTVALVIFALAALPSGVAAQAVGAASATATLIEHLIVVVGENISFDNLFATYEPPAGTTVDNLLSRGIVAKDGSPGPRFADAMQREASVRDRYAVTPATVGAFAKLPQPGTTYATDLPQCALDTRFPADLPNGPYRITRYVAYTATIGDPVHRFFQMCSRSTAGGRISSPGSR